MGKAFNYLTILIFVDIFFIATGQLTGSFGSILFNSILNIENLMTTGFFNELVGDASNILSSGLGVASLFGGSSVLIGAFLASKEFRILLIPVFASLALIASDFIILSSYLISLNPLIGISIMAPLSVLYIFTITEWLIGKD